MKAMRKMTVKLSSVKIDLVAETKGAWMDCDELPGVRFKVSSLNLPAFVAARSNLYNRLLRRYKKQEEIPLGTMSSEMGALFAQHILHDWEGFDQAYSPEVATSILTSPEYRVIVTAIEGCAARVGAPDVDFIEDEAKN